jgi:hypothetical protein
LFYAVRALSADKPAAAPSATSEPASAFLAPVLLRSIPLALRQQRREFSLYLDPLSPSRFDSIPTHEKVERTRWQQTQMKELILAIALTTAS